MYKFIHWYNRNKKEIWITLIAVIIIVSIIYYIIQNVNNDESESLVASNDDDIDEVIDNLNSITLSSEESALTGSEASISEDKISTIDKFIEYCNNQDVDSAYDLLSDECKDEMYSSVDTFKTNYYENIFGGEKKSVDVENWINDIYKLNISDDLLSSGGYSSDGVIQDYITIVQDDNEEYKLNINGFIKRTYPSKSGETNGLTINIKEVNTYMDYEVYTYEIINQSGASVTLGDLNVEYTTYLMDKNDVKYSAYLHELSSAQLELGIGQTKDIEIKYYSKYSSSKTIKYVFFNNVIFEDNEEESSSNSIRIDL